MRRQTVQTEVIALLADGHWWTCGELADCIDCWTASVRRVIKDLERRGFVRRFDDERPVMYGWTVKMRAAEDES